MAWKVDFTPSARKKLAKISPVDAQRILHYLYHRVQKMDNPRDVGKSLVGSRFAGLWRYRVGDYRIICELNDEKILILVVRIGHRRDVYEDH